MEKVDLIIDNAGQIVTCRSDGRAKKGAQMSDCGIVEAGAVAISGGRIAAVGERDDILKRFTAETVIDAAGRAVSPAFVECHTHVVFAGNRVDEFERRIKGADYLEILESGGGILSTVRQTRAADFDDLVAQSRRRLDNLLTNGAATCEVKTGYGLDTETELKMLGAILKLDKTHPCDLVPTFLGAHAVPPEYKGRENAYVDVVCDEMLPFVFKLFMTHLADIDENRIKAEIEARIDAGETAGIGSFQIPPMEWAAKLRNNPFFIDVFCEKNAFDLEQSRRVLEAGKRLGMKIKAHVDEFTNLGAARMAIELGATSIDHLDFISDAEIALLAASDTIGVVTPTVNFNFGSKEFADARKMIDMGCAIAVSTDYNPGSAPCSSPALAMAIACRYQRIAPAEAFCAATINAAFAVGLGWRTGSIETGKQADILILETDDYRQLAYEFGGNFVGGVIKNGRVFV